MVNRRREGVGGYRPFVASLLLADGLLAVPRIDGDAGRAQAGQFFDLARDFQREAEDLAARKGAEAGAEAGLASDPQFRIPTRQRAAGDIIETIGLAAQKHGENAEVLSRIAKLENAGLDPKAENPNSTARGLFQFVEATAAQYGLADPFDPAANADAAARLLRDNRNFLAKKLGREPSGGELYLAHQQGAGGALRLLENPSRPAAELVGEDAVRLNGGSADMTAQEFASLWLDKFERTQSPAQAAAQGRTEYAGRPLKLTGKSGVYGRAYDEAALRSFGEQFSANLQSAATQLYERHAEEPEALKLALDDLMRDDIAQNVPAPLRAGYRAAHARLSGAYLARAQVNRERKLKADETQAFSDRGKNLDDALSDAIAGLEPDAPATADLAAARAADLKAWQLEAARRGDISPEAAKRNIGDIDRQVVTSWHVAQARGKSSEEIAALAETLESDHKAGKLEGVDNRAMAKIREGLRNEHKAAATGEEKRETDFAGRLKDMEARAEAGSGVTGDELAQLDAEARFVPDGERLLLRARDRAEFADALWRRTPAEIDTMRRALDARAAAGGLSQAEAERRDMIPNVLERMEKVLKSDPYRWAARAGILADDPAIDWSGGEATEQSLQRRRDAWRTLTLRFGTASFFSASEKAALTGIADAGGPRLQAIADTFLVALGADAPAALAEIAPDAPVLANLAGMRLAGGNPALAAEVGASLEAQRAPGYKPPKFEEAAMATAEAEWLGGAYRADQRSLAAVTRTARLLYEKRARDTGIGEHTFARRSASRQLYERALDEAAGATWPGGVKHGGVAVVNGARIIAPPDMEAAAVERHLQALSEDELKQLPPIRVANKVAVKARQLQGARLVSVGDGRYWAALGDPNSESPRYVVGDAGDFWVLDIRRLKQLQSARTILPQHLRTKTGAIRQMLLEEDREAAALAAGEQ